MGRAVATFLLAVEVGAALPEYAAPHSHVVHDVLAPLDNRLDNRLDKTYHAFVRRIRAGNVQGERRLEPLEP